MEENNLSPNNFNNFGEIIHSWDIPEYHKPSRGRTWYAVAITVFILLLIYAVFTQNFLFALLILLFAAIIFMHSTREPLFLTFAISDKGIILNNRLYDFGSIDSFWIVEEPPFSQNVYFQFKSSFRPPLSIHLSDQNSAEVRQTLKKFIFEDTEKKDEPLSDLLWKILKL